MDDLVEIGVFAGADIDEPLGAPLYLQRHRIKSGQQTITVTVTSQPGRVGVDPNHRLIQRRRNDKVVSLTAPRSKSRADSTAWRAEYRKPNRDSLKVTKQLRGL